MTKDASTLAFEEWFNDYFVDESMEDRDAFLDCWNAATKEAHKSLEHFLYDRGYQDALKLSAPDREDKKDME